MVIDGSADSATAIDRMLLWDVTNGIARRSWARNKGAMNAIRREMERTLPCASPFPTWPTSRQSPMP